MAQTEQLRRTALYQWHVAAGAKMCPFAGWAMPLEYPSGTVTEHRAVRSGCGVFDVSHMGSVFVTGAAAVAAVNELVTNDLERLTPGDVQYTLLCDDAGGVVDDMMLTRLASDRILLVPNAANTAAVVEVLQARVGADAVHDASQAMAILAVQGPGAVTVLRQLGVPTDLAYLTMRPVRYGADQQHDVMVSRSGYTGESGFELLLPASGAVELWEDLVGVAAVTPCGLGARDTLRTEMGYPLHGQDLGPDISPVTASLSWAVAWEKPAFRGKEALEQQRASRTGRRLRGLRLTDRGIPRPGMTVRSGDTEVGVITSGTFSPLLGGGIALALLDRSVKLGDQVTVEVRGRALAAEVVKPPFVDRNPRD